MKQYRTHPVIQQKIIELRESGLTPEIISERTGVSTEAIRYALRQDKERERKRKAAAAKRKKQEEKDADTLWDRIQKRSAKNANH
jgi:orotate phosphoribosyltransferase-like protein